MAYSLISGGILLQRNFMHRNRQFRLDNPQRGPGKGYASLWESFRGGLEWD